jgi:hypothetical protein
MSVFYLPALLVKYLYPYSDPKKYGIRWAIFVTICTFFWGYSIHKTQDITLDTSFLPFYLFHFILTIALITTIKSKSSETI